MSDTPLAHSADTVRLYGRPGAEVMHFDPATVYESDIEPYGEDGPPSEPVEIEEWSVSSPRRQMPSAEALMEWISDWIAEYGETSADFDICPDTKDVKEAVEFLLDHIASKITWRQAEDHLASHWVTWNEAGEPLLDGEPMYVPAPTHIDGYGAQP